MHIILSNYVRYLNHIRYTVPETDNHHSQQNIPKSPRPMPIIGYNIRAATTLTFHMSISPGQTTANNCKTAFSLHVVQSASDDYNF